eukprot:g461.t1
MGQGQYGKHSSIPDTEVQYIHKDEYGNVHTLTRELSHQERYKTLAKSDDRGKLIMGIHRTFWHKGVSATAGRGHKIEKGKGMTYGVFNTTGDEVNSYGRPLTALELLRKKENDKKLALIRAEKKKRSEILDGFDPAFTITRAEGADENTLPSSHTCFNQLVLPEYQTVEKLIEKLMYAVKHGHGFHLS